MENIILDMFMDGNITQEVMNKCAKFVEEQQMAMGRTSQTLIWVADPTASEDLLSSDMFHILRNAIKTTTSMYKKEFNCPAFVYICGNTIDLISKMPDTSADCFSFDHVVSPD